MCEICLKPTIKTLQKHQWCFSGVFFVNNFEQSPMTHVLNPLGANHTKWSNTLKQIVCLSMFHHFVGLALKGLNFKSFEPPHHI